MTGVHAYPSSVVAKRAYQPPCTKSAAATSQPLAHNRTFSPSLLSRAVLAKFATPGLNQYLALSLLGE